MTAGGVGVEKKMDQGMDAPRETYFMQESKGWQMIDPVTTEKWVGCAAHRVVVRARAFLLQTEFKSCHFT